MQSVTLGGLLKILGILLAVIATAGFMLAYTLLQGGGEGAVIGGGLGLLSMTTGWLAAVVYNRGKRHLAASAEAMLARDKRPPVLYLRSFLDEKLDTRHSKLQAAAPTPGAAILALTTQEEKLVKVLNEIGPTIAIGRPNEPLPEVGAARMYVEETQWKNVIIGLLEKARLVVLRVGQSSEGLLWEEEQVLKRMQPEQTLFLVPDDPNSYRQLRSRINPYLYTELPVFEEWQEDEPTPRLRALLYFQRGWKPKMVDIDRVRSGGSDYYHFRRTLRPVVDQLNGVAVDEDLNERLRKTEAAEFRVIKIAAILIPLIGLLLAVNLLIEVVPAAFSIIGFVLIFLVSQFIWNRRQELRKMRLEI